MSDMWCQNKRCAEKKAIIRKVCLENKYVYPEISTPQELMGVYENG